MPNHLSQALAIAVLAAALAGCADVDEATQAQAPHDMAAARASCARFTGDAPAFASCVETQLAVISYQRRRALELQSAPSRVQPYGPRGQLCLPSAAGAATTC